MGRRRLWKRDRPLTVASSCREWPAPFLGSSAAPPTAQTEPHLDLNGRTAREFWSVPTKSAAVAPPAPRGFWFDPGAFLLRESDSTVWDVHPQQSFESTSEAAL